MGRGSLLAHPIPTSVPIPEKSLQPSKLIDRRWDREASSYEFRIATDSSFWIVWPRTKHPRVCRQSEHSMGTKTGARFMRVNLLAAATLLYGSIASMARAAPMQEGLGGPASGQIIVSLPNALSSSTGQMVSSPKFRSVFRRYHQSRNADAVDSNPSKRAAKRSGPHGLARNAATGCAHFRHLPTVGDAE